MIRGQLPALLGVAMLALVGCASPSGPTVQTATGTGQGEGGIGGTGMRPDEEGGLGGTGLFGTITGFGSIRLNGLKVEIPADITAAGLAVGDTVAVEAVRHGATLVAHRVTNLLPLTGPIDRLDSKRRQMSVMGTPVLLEQGATLVDRAGGALAPGVLAVGDWLEVSGIWRSGAVVASRLVRIPAADRAHAAGLLGGDGTIRSIGGTAIDLACCDAPAPGFAEVSGAYRDGRLVADRVDAGTSALFTPSVERLVVEGYLARNSNDPGFHLSGFGIPMDPASPVPPIVGQRAVFVGRLDGDFLIERSFPIPADPAARQQALEPIGSSLLE